MIQKKYIFLFSFFLLFFSLALPTHAATLFFAPSSGDFSVGDTFSTEVFVDTEGVAINSFQISVSYPNNLLTFVSASTDGAVIPPNNFFGRPVDTGTTIDYQSVIVTPGFTGAKGKIVTLTFLANSAGQAKVAFDYASVLANDGHGTNVLTGTGTGLYTLSIPPLPTLPPEPTTPPIPPVVVPAPVIAPTTSPTQEPTEATPSATTTPTSETTLPPTSNIQSGPQGQNGSASASLGQSLISFLKDFFTNQNTRTAAKVVAVTGVSFALISLIAHLFQIRVWSVFMAVLGVRRRKPWGVVYDSVTKQPLDPAYVVLKDESGTEVATSITDLDGRFGLLAKPGKYTLEANKTHYHFPSMRLKGMVRDELYSDLYFGEQFGIIESNQVVAKNIPMDPESFDWNEYMKKAEKLNAFYRARDFWLYRVSNAFFYFGFFVSALAYMLVPDVFNACVILTYLVFLLFRRTIFPVRLHGSVVRKGVGSPLPFAIVHIWSASLRVEITHKAADITGHYYALVPNGLYYATIDEQKPDGTYMNIFTSIAFKVTDGIVREHFEV